MVAFLVLETAMIGCFVALDLLLFFLFFEALLFPMYLIIGGWGSERRVYAAVKFFLFTMAGSAFLLIGDPVPVLPGRDPQLGHGRRSTSRRCSALSLPTATARWLFLAFFVAFAVKMPLFPLHTWLPDAHTEAPTAGLAGPGAVAAQGGRVRADPVQPVAVPRGVDVLPELRAWSSRVIGIVYGAVVALIQTDLKRLVAYSSVSHLGFVVLGTFAFTAAGHVRQRAADGQPRALHRGAVPAGRDAVRPDPHPRPDEDGRAGRQRCPSTAPSCCSSRCPRSGCPG